MPFIPVDETARIAITYVNNLGNTAVNVIHVATDEAPITPSVLAAMCDVVEDWLAEGWAGVASNLWTATLLEARDLTSQDSFGLDRDIAEAGTITGEAMPSNVTVAMSLRSGFIGRSRRGRLYHVGLAETMVTGDYLASAAITNLPLNYNLLRTALATAGFTWVVVSYQSNNVPRVAGLKTPITSVILTDTRVDHQNRRLPQPG